MLREIKRVLTRSLSDHTRFDSIVLEKTRTWCVIISLILQITLVIIQLYILHHLIGIH